MHNKPETFETDFGDYHIAKTEKGIHDEDTYIFDETGFRARVGKDQWVITKDDISTRLYIEDLDNREFVTSVERIGGGGNVIPNMIPVARSRYYLPVTTCPGMR